ncbi:WRKY transcription factor 22 [Triticum urartu]|uniref:WRKY transcription factor 22 n=1 Tax=Triticum urartu TaxID=4572 RepID=M8AGB4_TRIUA|nr:WRKY transcription factor 22 [Triticum urartu]
MAQRQRRGHEQPKKEKKVVKKVVKRVAADGTSADPWAWRKYGQKPIKGSPYPRGILVEETFVVTPWVTAPGGAAGWS